MPHDESLNGWSDAETRDFWTWLVSHRRNISLLNECRIFVGTFMDEPSTDSLSYVEIISLLEKGIRAIVERDTSRFE